MSKFLDNTGLSYLIGKIKTTFVAKTNTSIVQGVDVDSTPTQNSTHLITSGGVYNSVVTTQRKVEIESASGTTLSADENKYYAFSSEVGTLAITLPAPSDLTHLTSVVFAMTTGSTPAVTFSATAINGTTPPIYTQDGFAIEASTSYEVNAIFNGASWILALIKITTTPISSSSSS